MDRGKKIKQVRFAGDIATVVRLADEIWREHYTPIIGQAQVEYMLDKFQSASAIADQIEDGAHYYIIDFNEKSVGYFSYYLQEDTLFLSKIYVQSALRGKGLGRAAVDFIIEKAKEAGRRSISLTVNKNNNHTIEAYRKIGFRLVKPIVMDIGGGFVMDDYYMEKVLELQ